MSIKNKGHELYFHKHKQTEVPCFQQAGLVGSATCLDENSVHFGSGILQAIQLTCPMSWGADTLADRPYLRMGLDMVTDNGLIFVGNLM